MRFACLTNPQCESGSRRSATLLGAIKRCFSNQFDESMSDFRAEGLLELSDIEGDMFERESER
jgi:hypothetical protein